jgi:hypothetical protein
MVKKTKILEQHDETTKTNPLITELDLIEKPKKERKIKTKIKTKIKNTLHEHESEFLHQECNVIISEIYSEKKEKEVELLDLVPVPIEEEILKTSGGTKKRGRKPKGGKIVLQMLPKTNSNESKPNIILHLKCSLKDIQNDLFNNNEVESYHFSTGKNDLNYEIIIKENNILPTNYLVGELESNSNNTFHSFEEDSIGEINTNSLSKNNDLKLIWKKLKQLEYNLHINNISDKKSACFWCTYDFDNPPIYIPKHFIKDSYHVYGCFCSPECATAFLMEENIDSSAKFERYQLLNNIYSKIYDYNVNIKPSPNPYYMLEKYYGNLSIQEYRSLLKNERLFLIVDKPLTRILPELHEDNDDFIINNKIIPSSTMPLKGKLRKKITGKNNSIVNDKFGFS